MYTLSDEVELILEGIKPDIKGSQLQQASFIQAQGERASFQWSNALCKY